MPKKINILLFLIVSLLIVTTVTVQSSFQHWSAQWDLDFWYIYNASLMSSGIQQEWYDHPGTTFLSIYSIFYKIYSFVDHSFIYKINEIKEASDPDLVLQKLYFVTRIFDSINIILIVFFTFKISKILSSKDHFAYFLTFTLISSASFLNNLSILNPEDWAILFFLISFYFFLNFYVQSNVNFLILSGLFFLFAFFSKINILFLFFFIILLIPLFYEMYLPKNNSPIQKSLEKHFKLIFISYLLILLFYFVIQIFLLGRLDAFQKNISLDAFIIITINFLLMSFFIIISKFNLVKFKRYFSIFILFFSGFVIGLIIFVAIDILNIAKLNPKILVHLVKPFYKMLNFAYAPEGLDSVMLGDALTGNLTITINKVFLVISKVFSNFYFDNFLFIGLCSIFLISIYKDLKIKNTYSFLFKMIFFLGLVINTLIFNFRFYTEYLIYIHIFYVILLSACFKNISNKLINSFCTISIICLTFFLPINNFVSQPVSVDSRNAQTTSLKKILLTRSSKLIPLCNNFGSHQPPDNYFIFERYSKQFDADTFSKICNLPKSRFRGDKYVLE
jgi:hypothetical protein